LKRKMNLCLQQVFWGSSLLCSQQVCWMFDERFILSNVVSLKFDIFACK
jgi:hypothetical protein